MTKLTSTQLLAVRYLRSHGLQQGDIAFYLDVSRQVISYQLKKLRRAFLDKEESQQSNGAGVVSPLVGLLSDPPPPCSSCVEPDTCINYVQMAAYAQMEDLPKHQKIAVLLALLQEVEQE
tara:strand:- start:9942 stop:10301 length:360 start_codon:yes stop_codon:yes gene_type:complete